MKTPLNILIALCAAACLLGPGSAQAGILDDLRDQVEQMSDRDDDRRGGRSERQRPKVSLDAAVRKVEKRFGGKVVKAETRYRDGRPMHRIKVLTNGRMRTVVVDGMTGSIR